MKDGDLVKYHKAGKTLDELGFIVGQTYEILFSGPGKFIVESETNKVAHVVYENEPTHESDCFEVLK